MNKEVVIIGGGVLGGMVSNGVSTLLPVSESPIMNIILAGASAFGATKVSGTTTSANLLRGACMGSALVQIMGAVKKVAGKNLATTLSGTSKITQFAKGAVGLGCSVDNGLNGQFVGADGQLYQYDENGLNGQFMDEAGNVFELADDGLKGSVEELYQHNALHGVASVYGEEENGLNGSVEELYAQNY